jgi:hypothetical protein
MFFSTPNVKTNGSTLIWREAANMDKAVSNKKREKKGGLQLSD